MINMKRSGNDSSEEENEINQDQINKLLEEGEALSTEMNEETLIICLKSLKENIKLNSNLRLKFSGDPEKYMKSEVDLHEEIKVLQRIAAYPNLIQTFIDQQGVEILISLLLHENLDIVNDASIVIEEITDSDYLQDIQNPKEFLEIFISNNLFNMCVNNLLRTDDIHNKEDEQIVSDILSILENFLDVYPFSSKLLGERTKLISWLLNRVRVGEINKIKVFASEILNTLTQTSTENQIIVAKKEGMPHLLKIIIENQNNGKIISGDDEEYIQNIVNTICGCLMSKENQTIFRNSDGINITLQLLKENILFRNLGVKILDFATQNNPKNSKELVESGGLSPLFSYFMGKGLKNKKKFESLIDISEEHCLTIFSSLIKFLKGVPLDRLVYKFKENHQEKCERLFEFYKKFQNKLNQLAINKESEENDEDEDEGDEKEYYSRFNSGLFNIQSLSIIIGFLLTTEHEDIKIKINKLCVINNISVEEIKRNLNELNSHLGEESFGETSGNDSEFTSNKHFIGNIIKKI